MIEFNRLAAGRVVRRLRKERKLSQEVFSGLAGLARSHLTMIESGSKQANFETVWRIANAFGHAAACVGTVDRTGNGSVGRWRATAGMKCVTIPQNKEWSIYG